MKTYIFVDHNALNNPRTFGKAFLYKVKASGEQEAWERFARFAKSNFGLSSEITWTTLKVSHPRDR